MERMKSKAGYGAVVVLTLIIALTHEGEFPRFLLGFEIVLAAALFFSLKVLAGKIEVHFRLPVFADSRSKEIVVEAEIVNHSILPVPALTAGFIWEDVISGERGTVQMPAMADSRGRSAARFRLRAGHCGVIRVLPGEVWVKDYLALFRRKTAPAPGNPEYAVLPDWTEAEAGSAEKRQRTGGSEEADGDRSGDDYSEIRDIRPYRRGDARHSIHWKLSAKMDDLMVREPSDTADTAVLIFLDLYTADKDALARSDQARSELDRFYERAAAASHRLLTDGVRHYVVWADLEEQEKRAGSGNGIVRYEVRDESSFRGMLTALVHTPLSSRRADLDLLYKERFSDETFREVGRLSLEAGGSRKRKKTKTGK